MSLTISVLWDTYAVAHARKKARKRRLAALRQAEKQRNLTVKPAWNNPSYYYRKHKTQDQLLADVRDALIPSNVKEN